MVDTNGTTGGEKGDTGSNPVPPATLGNLRDRLMQAVSPAFQGKSPAGMSSEPVILEEHVVGEAPASPVAQTQPELPVPKFAPLPSTSAPVKAPTPAPSPTTATPKPLQAPAPAKKPADVTAEDVGLVIPKPSLQSSISVTPKPMMQMGSTLKTPPVTPAKPVSVPSLDTPLEKVLPSSLSLDPIPQPIQESATPRPSSINRMQETDIDSAAALVRPEPTSMPSNPPEMIHVPPAIAVEPPVTSPTSAPAASAAARQESAPQNGDMNNDIQRILSQVKLPERREQKGIADPKPVPEAPKNIAAMITKPPTDLQEAQAMAAKPEGNTISSVHTLKDDLQHVVKEKKMSLVRAVALEQDKKRDELIEEEFGRKERRRRTTGILFASFLLFGLGFAALFGVYFVMMSHSGTDVQQLNSLVFAEQSVALPMDNSQPSELKRRVAIARQGQVGSLGSITRIVPLYQQTTQTEPVPATTQQFFKAMGFNAPDDLLKALGDTFFFGLHVVDKNSPILVVPVTNYDRAFAGMLAWEAAMNTDLSPAFTPVSTTILDANGIPSTRTFQDDVMRNYDVRELKDDSGAVVLYYSFPSKNILIIAESPYSFPEILSRLQSLRRL